MKVAAVIASNREDRLLDFLDAWSPFPWNETIVIEDGPARSFVLEEKFATSIFHYAWADIESDAEVVDAAIFSRRDSGIKAYGFWTAIRGGADIVIALDDDCLPAGAPAGFVADHIAALSPRARWVPSIDGSLTRGVPYFDLGSIQGAVANMGLWRGVADYDAPQTLALQRSGLLHHSLNPPPGNRLMHPQNYWPWCAMNIAFRREVAPLMYMPKMGLASPYRRFDDIWSGIILQRCCRHLGLSLASGEPQIRHVRASDPLVNLEKEAPGIRANEDFWKVVEKTPLGEAMRTPLECAEAVASHLASARDGDGPTSNPALACYLVEESARMRAWCYMFRRAGWN